MALTPLNRPILVVEDCDEDFDTALEALRKVGVSHNVHRAVSGDECLALLRGLPEAAPLHPDLVLMDLNIPGTDGREALREIKSDPVLKTTPVVILSTSSNPRDLAVCYESGANAYHVKPVRYPEHIDLLEQIFRYWLERVALRKNGFKRP